MSLKLRDLIKAVRACKTAAEERAVIAKECAAIRTSFKEEETEYRHRNVAKLLYIHMLGYPTHWGQMECVKLIASQFYSDKRVGYLAIMVLLDETQEVLTLVTNSLKNDLNHPNQFIAGLALCTLGNISSAGIARDLAPEVEKLLGSTNPYIRKKAALCAIRILRKCPDLMENFVPRIRALLTDKSHGVLLTATTLMIELCEMDSHNVEFFRKLAPTLVRILKNLVMSGYAPEYDVSGITDPFLQVKILKLLGLLGKGDAEASDSMNDILAQIATNTDHSRNVGNAILYECVKTIIGIEAENGLRVLAINVLGRFLQNRDNNIRYVALTTLSKVVTHDIDAVQRHRNTIVDCLKDPDLSIRRRALDLIYSLVDDSNIKVLAHELLTFLSNANIELRADLAVKLCNVTEKYAPSKRWHVDTILRVLSIAGNCVPEETSANLINLIASTPELHSYAVQKMFIELTNSIQQQRLVQVAVWCIGEFGDLLVAPSGSQEITVTEKDVCDLLERILRNTLTSNITKEYVLTALMKLTTRFSSNTEKLRTLIAAYQNNFDVELQQRAVEYTKIFNWDNIRKSLLERIPVVEDNKPIRASTEVPVPTTQATNSLISWEDDLLGGGPVASNQPVAAPKPSPVPNLMEELFGSGPTTAAPTTSTTASLDPLADLLGPITSSTTQSTIPTNPLAALGLGTPTSKGPLTAYQKNGVTITFDVTKPVQNQPNQTQVTATFTNSLGSPLTNFEFKVAVPKYMKIQVNPPSASVVPPSNSGSVTQVFKLLNSAHGEKPLLVKIKLDYQVNGGPVSDIADVNIDSY